MQTELDFCVQDLGKVSGPVLVSLLNWVFPYMYAIDRTHIWSETLPPKKKLKPSENQKPLNLFITKRPSMSLSESSSDDSCRASVYCRGEQVHELQKYWLHSVSNLGHRSARILEMNLNYFGTFLCNLNIHASWRKSKAFDTEHRLPDST